MTRSAATELDRAVSGAVAFLRRRQLPHGEFTTLLFADRALSNPRFDSSPFITSFVLYALTHVRAEAVEDVVAKAASFLLAEMEPGGVWRYWSSRQHKHCRLPPDADDTACISYALARAGYRVPSNRWAFYGARDEEGRFKTWMFPTRGSWRTPRFLVARAAGYARARVRTAKVTTPEHEDPRFRIMHIVRDDVDPVANANVLLHLGERGGTQPALRFVIDAVLQPQPARSLYYEDPLALDYAAARAFRHAVPALSVAREPVVARIRERVAAAEPLNALQAALAASTLLSFAAASDLVAQLLRLIVNAQRSDGGWNAYAFYNVWGSEELTTGLCLEVLARCRALAEAVPDR